MKAVILAAGKGTRLQPLTHTIPKGLIDVNNKPILEHIIESIKNIVDEIIIVIGYKGDLIQNYFKNKYESIPITYVIQEEALGTGHALLQAKPYLKDKFIVLNGDDIYSSKDLENISKYNFALLSYEVSNPENFGVIVGENILEEIIEKPKIFISNKVNTGVYVLTTEIFKHNLVKSSRGEYEIIDYLNYIIQQSKHLIHIVPISNYWLPINSHGQLEIAKAFFNK